MYRFATTIFLSAFLLFQVQPIIARFVVPWFGGSAAVWTVCLLFFQVVLLAGYGYAHGSIRYLKPRQQAVVHLVLLALSAVVVLALRITPAPFLKPTGNEEPGGRILLLLALTVGLPYFTLSTTGPLLQAWYAADAARRGQSETTYPYRLYSLSNFGSMLGLLSYPVLVEPVLTIPQQALVWSVGFLIFAGFCGAITWNLAFAKENAAQEKVTSASPAAPKPRLPQYLAWLALAACTSTLLIAVTNHISQNVAAVPLLWVLPLSLYLLSFIICFGGKGNWKWNWWFAPLPLLAFPAMAYALAAGNENLRVAVLLPIWLGGLFVACVLCHGELARSKPAPQYLTAFYAVMSLGGAIGGVFVGLIAPRVFNAFYELPLAVGAVAVIAVAILFSTRPRPATPGIKNVLAGTGLLWLCAGTGFFLYYLASETRSAVQGYRLSTRNFYGVLQVRDYDDGDEARRTLNNGTILHGEQWLSPQWRTLPTTYYTKESGVGRTILAMQARKQNVRVGVIGLGTGTLATYGRAGDTVVYYDLNPDVIRVAKTQFTYLDDSAARIELVVGDARLALEREAPRQFDVLVVDAFSSDSIPIHLLTREAFAEYNRHLDAGGVLCVHVTNRHVDLKPVVRAGADALSKNALDVLSDGNDDTGANPADWIMVAAPRVNKTLAASKAFVDADPELLAPNNGFRPWTDDYSNLFALLKRAGD